MNSLQSAVNSVQPPTLDEFAETLEDPDFYSQAELTELWEERYGKVSARQSATSTETTTEDAPRLRDTPANRALKRKAC